MAGETAPPNAPVIPLVYLNGFEITNSLSDIAIVAMVDGIPQLRLSLSFTTAKTLGNVLTGAIADFEKKTGHSIMTMEDVGRGLEAKNVPN